MKFVPAPPVKPAFQPVMLRIESINELNLLRDIAYVASNHACNPFTMSAGSKLHALVAAEQEKQK